MRRIENSIFQILVKKKVIDLNNPLNIFKNEEISGTGFLIDKNEILTCFHVIDNSVNIKVKYNETEINAKIKYVFPDDDLAIICLENNSFKFNILDYKIITTNENYDVTTVGFPYSSKNIIITKGIISGYQDSLIQTDSSLNSGNSGGPIMKDNKYIGVNQSKMAGDASNIGFCIPIFRFLIFWKLNKDKLKKVNRKPKLLFKYQQIKQKEYFNKEGVIITKIHENSPLKNSGIVLGDIIMSINNYLVNNEGYIKFDFFPEKIELNDLHLWFVAGDEIFIKYYSIKSQTIKITKIIFQNIKTNLPEYFYDLTDPYYYENKGLIFSIITEYHFEKFSTLELNIIQKIQIYERLGNYKNQFTIYLSNIDYNKLKFTNYPIGDIIIEIDDIPITDINIFKQIITTPIKKFKTVNNELFYIE
jgi:S1-C subfamily serine protease